VAAYAEVVGERLEMRALSFTSGPVQRAEGKGPLREPVALGQDLAHQLKPAA